MGTAARDLEQQRDRQADRSAAQCRICATDIATDDGGMHIFAEDGRRHYLQTKIRKYLHILVSETRAHFRAYLRAAGILFFPSPFFFPSHFLSPFLSFIFSSFQNSSSPSPLRGKCRDHVLVAAEFRNSRRRSADLSRFFEIGRNRTPIFSAKIRSRRFSVITVDVREKSAMKNISR